LETLLVEKVVDTDRLLEDLLLGSACIDDDALFSSQDDHNTCLETSTYDPGADDNSRVSAQEDTTTHIGYNVIQKEISPTDGV
jgi:hypothetical protein